MDPISDPSEFQRFSSKDRILVPDSSISCGDVATAHDLAFRSHLCGRGDSACIATPGNRPPTGLQNMGELVGHLAGKSWKNLGIWWVLMDKAGKS